MFFTRQVLHWIVYVFTSEQVYSNDGSKVIKIDTNFTRQVLHWIVYVFTSEQVYSNDGSKVIIYDGIDINFTRET